MPQSGIDQLADAVLRRCGDDPFDLAIVLGSGLGALAAELDQAEEFAYGQFPCFPEGSVAGHAGRLVGGTLQGWRVLLFQGRFHLYQGLSARQAALPATIAHRLGCPRLLLTSAVGGIEPAYRPGDFVYIADHINLLGDNPLRGVDDNPFVDLSALYRQDLFSGLLTRARALGIGLHRGVLAAMPGPSYETPAEIRMLRLLGAQVVSMSMVPEAILAAYLGLEVVGLSLVANAAAGLASQPLNHEEVLAVGRRGAEQLSALARELIRLWQQNPV
ncbi:purine nucleoside phosphorylase [Desulfuromonas versatilis]|uniref:Purine nucleoside phosphorylase n=1 Tax=Desulfuromonas versatilis TaxID=2802975 RepID=A0ABM8HWR3_9BACT|nr:purine-nucleoside phosphorylase [Desulfuromonas versatilis]BCR05552.1 purine nucleoside phosphorylase [Desulfuromonas versatilis]